MAAEAGPTAVPAPPLPRGGRRRHRRGQGRQQRSGLGESGPAPSFSNLPGSSMLCREANEAHLALLSTLPSHMMNVNTMAMICPPCMNPETTQQQIQNEKMIREFKTMPCVLEGAVASHDHRCCPFYHSERDRRRLVLSEGGVALYSAEPCEEQFDDQRQCSHGESCRLCHSTAELLYHPDFFRKRLCHQEKRCPRGRFCAFAHSRQELLVPNFSELEESEPTEDFIAWRFKTQWCPIGGPHDWENCVYAHTYRDWRRVPTLGYSSRPCPHWVQSVTTGPAELMYADRCPRGMSCPLAHGAKEQLYHPQFYKTSPCSEANCKRGTLCAFTHGIHDTRRPRTDDPLPSAVRDPILQAVELLGRNQPTFWSPPRYHALEDPPHNSKGSGRGKGGNRSRGGSNASALAYAQQQHDRHNGIMDQFGMDCPFLPAALPSIANNRQQGQSVGEQSLHAYPPYPPMSSQYPMCQWVPMGSEPPTQLLPPSMGYGQVMDPSWTMPMGYSPWVCGGYMQPQQNGMQPGLQPHCFMTMPPTSPQHHGEANQVSEELTGGEQDGKVGLDMSPKSTSGSRSDSMGFGMDASQMPAFQLPHDMYGVMSLGALGGGMPPLPLFAGGEDFFSGRTARKIRKAREGLRTPSSLGSPPLSNAPTSVPSPRLPEADSNSSHAGASDDARPMALEAPGDGVLNMSRIKEMSGMLLTDASLAAADGMPLHLEQQFALHNFAEAPSPASPCHVPLA